MASLVEAVLAALAALTPAVSQRERGSASQAAPRKVPM
jgi:hypothetical protein